MAIDKRSTTSNNSSERIITGQHVSKPIWNQYHGFRAWLADLTKIDNPRRREHEWLRLVREPQFKDQCSRYAQAVKVMRVVMGGAIDMKTMGRLLTMICLAVAGSVRARKRRGRVVTRAGAANGAGVDGAIGKMEYEGGSGEKGNEVEVGSAGRIESADGDEMDVDGYGDKDDLDEMQIDDDSFHDSALPPSSPTPLPGVFPPKTPARPPMAAQLPTPDSTPYAQFHHGFGGERADDKTGRFQSSSDVSRRRTFRSYI